MQTGHLYHRVPADLKGHILYPLNQLKSIYPSLYDTKATTYQGREAVMQARIPLLNCLWNDVPHILYQGRLDISDVRVIEVP